MLLENLVGLGSDAAIRQNKSVGFLIMCGNRDGKALPDYLWYISINRITIRETSAMIKALLTSQEFRLRDLSTQS